LKIFLCVNIIQLKQCLVFYFYCINYLKKSQQLINIGGQPIQLAGKVVIEHDDYISGAAKKNTPYESNHENARNIDILI